MRIFIYAQLLLWLAMPSFAEAPFSFDAAPGRLPKDVVPQNYGIALVPDIATHLLRGTEAITLTVRRPTDTLTFNSLNERLEHALFDGRPIAEVSSDDRSQLTRITLSKPANARFAPTDLLL